MADKGFDPQFGARPLNRAIQKYLEDQIAEEILKGSVNEGDTLIADYSGEGDALTLKAKKKRASKKKEEGPKE